MSRSTLTIALLVCAVFWFLIGSASRDGDVAAARQEVAKLRHDSAALADSAKVVRVQFRHDTITLLKTERAYRTLRDTLTLTDTVMVEKALNAADSTIGACHSALNDCKTLMGVLTEQRDNAEAKAASYRQMIPTRRSRFAAAAKWLVVGVASGIVAGQVLR